MIWINQEIPDFELFLSMDPADLAPVLLKIADEAQREGNRGNFHPQAVRPAFEGDAAIVGRVASPYPRARQSDFDARLMEGWQWLRIHLLIMPYELGTDHGWMRLSRRGEALVREGSFKQFREAAAFPKALLHASIAEKVWVMIARGDLEDAVFSAFKQVEIAVRAAGKFAATEVGVDLMRRAFNPDKGPLTELSHPKPEREALMALFSGAIGSYKNPHSHRTVTISEAREAQEMVLLASHLLRIVEARVQK